VGFVLNEFNCSTEVAVGFAGVGLTTGLVSAGAYFLQMELVKRLSAQQPSQDASADDPGHSGPASSSSSQRSESLVELSPQDVPPQEYEGQELDS
jgi:Na+/glutamate symporter